jgi:hypothetical protein
MNSSNSLSRKTQDSCQSVESKWDIAIKAANYEIEILAKKQKQLEQSVKIFRMNKRDGVPWPGDQQKSPQEGGQG